MKTQKDIGHAEPSASDRRRLVGMRDNMEAALNRLVQDYRDLEGLNRELERKARSTSAELEVAKSRLKSVHKDVKQVQAQGANLLTALFRGLKGPLNAIEEHIEQLALECRRGENGASWDRLRSEVHRLWRIIDDLATVEAVQLGTTQLKLEAVNLEEVVDSVAGEHQDVTRSKGVILNKVVAKALPHVLGDGNQLKSALGHLVDNAICCTPTGGVVTILANGNRSGDQVRLSVIDMRRNTLDKTVMGMLQGTFPGNLRSADDIEHVDLGLMVAGQIINAHNGEIMVESQAGKGTVFTLSLPTAECGAMKNI